MKKDRFLTGILIGIGVLVVLALVLFFLRQDKQEYRSENTPEAVAHNYILAVLGKDYERAYTYLADLDRKPTYEEFRQAFFNGQVNPASSGADIGSVNINGDEATLSLTLYYGYNDPFSSRQGQQEQALLVNQGGVWKVSSMPYMYWSWDWYGTNPKSAP